jgi:hypothetical protein
MDSSKEYPVLNEVYFSPKHVVDWPHNCVCFVLCLSTNKECPLQNVILWKSVDIWYYPFLGNSILLAFQYCPILMQRSRIVVFKE